MSYSALTPLWPSQELYFWRHKNFSVNIRERKNMFLGAIRGLDEFDVVLSVNIHWLQWCNLKKDKWVRVLKIPILQISVNHLVHWFWRSLEPEDSIESTEALPFWGTAAFECSDDQHQLIYFQTLNWYRLASFWFTWSAQRGAVAGDVPPPPRHIVT